MDFHTVVIFACSRCFCLKRKRFPSVCPVTGNSPSEESEERDKEPRTLTYPAYIASLLDTGAKRMAAGVRMDCTSQGQCPRSCHLCHMSPRAAQGRQQSEPVLLQITKAAPIYELVSNNETYQVCTVLILNEVGLSNVWKHQVHYITFHNTLGIGACISSHPPELDYLTFHVWLKGAFIALIMPPSKFYFDLENVNIFTIFSSKLL